MNVRRSCTWLKVQIFYFRRQGNACHDTVRTLEACTCPVDSTLFQTELLLLLEILLIPVSACLCVDVREKNSLTAAEEIKSSPILLLLLFPLSAVLPVMGWASVTALDVQGEWYYLDSVM